MLAMSMMLGGLPVYDITLPSNRAQWRKSVDGTQIPSTAPVLLILRINNVIEIQSNSTSVAAIHLDSLFAGSEVQIINQGYLLGDGGNGAEGAFAGGNGSVGGPAIRADFTGLLKLTNSAGRIWGGGSGGGGGGTPGIWNAVDAAYDSGIEGGGGGGGAGGGTGGTSTGNSGTAGTTGSVGAPGAGGGTPLANSSGGAGGAYGAAGVAGSDGLKSGGPENGQVYTSGGLAGAAGYAIRHNAGTTVSFVSGSSSPNVKGTVGS